MSDHGFHVITNVNTHMVVDRNTGRCLGGAGSSYYRPWVYPFYTPAGNVVVQPFPHDHPWHNGIFVGQSPVIFKERRLNFWGVPLDRCAGDIIARPSGRVAAVEPPTFATRKNGVRLTFDCVWRDQDDQPVLNETRTIDLYAANDATICDIVSAKTAIYGSVELSQTKFGSIGMCVEPRLLPKMGGIILADGNRQGDVTCVHEMDSDYVAYENDLERGHRFGVCMTVLDEGVRGPWFIRDTGMAMYNRTWRGAVRIDEGKTWVCSLRFAAYEGALTEARARAWMGAF